MAYCIAMNCIEEGNGQDGLCSRCRADYAMDPTRPSAVADKLRDDFESVALRSARSLQMEHADVNLKRSEDAYRKESDMTYCVVDRCTNRAIAASDQCIKCLSQKIASKREAADRAMAVKLTKILARGDQMEAAQAIMNSVKSDGGSTSYYELELTDRMVDGIQSQVSKGETATLQTGDVIELLVGNDFDAGNVIKALRRIFESKKGKGKEGVEQTYDIKKCHYFIDEVEKKL